MPDFLFQISLPPASEAFEQMLPMQREHINQMFSDGALISYSVSSMRDLAWCVIHAEDEAVAMGLIADFPLFSFFTDVKCFPLLFHNSLSPALPGISMN